MDGFRADLHIHSRYSRATSKSLTLRQLAAWARVKGLHLLGSGDFTHPGWMAEIERDLTPGANGLFSLNDPKGLEKEIPASDGPLPPGETLFALQTEVSLIYKRAGKVRKIHNLVYMPSLDAAKKFTATLAKVGNLESDGRPILGLDSRHLMEMVLSSGEGAFLVPAHVWTPWFSLFGSKSGFDTIEECFGSLSGEIFALETGLSSDPRMNWMVSALDRFRMVSSSDAHSGEKLGREASLFAGEVSYPGILGALRGTSQLTRFLGTLEFFPEEGKYHLDGHKACGVVYEPEATRAAGGICPVCGKPLTVGVLSRVRELADRAQPVQPKDQPGFTSLIPLPEILSEILDSGASSKKVQSFYARLIKRFGPELDVLGSVPPEDLARLSKPLAEAISRMRAGNVIREPGYDGQYGRITLFSSQERRELISGRLLAPAPARAKQPSARTAPAKTPAEPGIPVPAAPPVPEAVARRDALNPAQREAVDSREHRLLVLAGPGTGKTHTLIERIAALLEAGIPARRILALTFTRRAAGELGARLAALEGEGLALPRAETLHALAFEHWTEACGQPPVLLNEDAARRLFAEVNPELTGPKLKAAWRDLELARQRLTLASASPKPAKKSRLVQTFPHMPSAEEIEHMRASVRAGRTADQMLMGMIARERQAEVKVSADPGKPGERYALQKRSWNLADYTDLLEFFLQNIKAGVYLNPYSHILLDEIQDLTPLQLAVAGALAQTGERDGPGPGASLFAIGDPDQSIYGFRGAAPDILSWFSGAFPAAKVIRLTDNYRSRQPLLDLAAGLFPDNPPLASRLPAPRQKESEITLFSAPESGREASWIAEKIRALLGPTSSTLLGPGHGPLMSPGDIAVLVRLSAQIAPIAKILTRQGIPVAAPQAEAFWSEPRVAALLAAAGRILGLAPEQGMTPADCPDQILAKGPRQIAAFLGDNPPFDRLFWQGPEFAALCRAFEEQGGWAGLLTFVAARTEDELVSLKAEKVQIMTLHAAKGLEFAAVFLPAVEDGLIPFAGPAFLTGKLTPKDEAPDESEEKRLFYVGLTRAKSHLYVSHAARREMYGRKLALKPSRFLRSLDLEGVRKSALVAKTVRREKQLGLFGDEG